MLGLKPPDQWNWPLLAGIVRQRDAWPMLCQPADVPLAAQLAAAVGLAVRRTGPDRIELSTRESTLGGPIGPRRCFRERQR